MNDIAYKQIEHLPIDWNSFIGDEESFPTFLKDYNKSKKKFHLEYSSYQQLLFYSLDKRQNIIKCLQQLVTLAQMATLSGGIATKVVFNIYKDEHEGNILQEYTLTTIEDEEETTTIIKKEFENSDYPTISVNGEYNSLHMTVILEHNWTCAFKNVCVELDDLLQT